MTRITTEIDYSTDGKQTGCLRLPHSVHRSAYGWIGIPVVVIQNGSGPTCLLLAGNHGDEYEGQLTLMKLCQTVEAADVQGRLIILPAVNYPAVMAGTRTSPIDAGNLNRSFPGDPDGTPTPAIAHYIEHELLPMADYCIDLHSGGSSLMYIPAALACTVDDPETVRKQSEMLTAFGAPISCWVRVGDEERRMIAAAARTNVATIGTELGGGGVTSVESVSVAFAGVARVLRHLGIVPGLDVSEAEGSPQEMELGGPEYFVYSPDYGIWEPLVELGDVVEKNQPAARIYFPAHPWRTPVVCHFQTAGTVVCKRTFSPVERGDCLFHLATTKS